jgi:hypothetical protein
VKNPILTTYDTNLKRAQNSTWSKFIQANKNDLYVVGGANIQPALLPYTFDVSRHTLKVDVFTGAVTRCDDLHYGRYAFAICCIESYIYVLGGFNLEKHMNTNECERYDILKDKWEVLPPETTI